MKRKFLTLSIVLLISVGAYAQKDQIKIAQSAFEKGNSQDALGILKKVEYLITNSPDEVKSEFYFLKGNVLKDMASKNTDMYNNFTLAAESYRDLIKTENDAGKYKHIVQANTALREMKLNLLKSAIDDFKEGKYKECAEKRYKIYLVDKKDTLNLFNAAAVSISAKDYDSAILYYEELKKINYSGKGLIYFATNKETKSEDVFVTAGARSASIADGIYEKPRDEFSPSKRLEINKNLAFSYLEKNDLANAEICYNKVLEIDPNFIDAYLNLVYVKMELKKDLMDKMAALGITPKEMEQYDELKVKKDELVKSAIPYLKKALEIEPKNQGVVKSLLGVYKSLDMTNDYNSLKASM